MSRTPLERDIARQIAADGPMPLDRFMALALGHPRHGYYMTRDPFGAKGDFITAPEVSQMFGELIGAWAAALWQQMGAPARVRLVELGPGRGTLMADLLRAARVLPGFAAAAEVHLVEMSPLLRQAQQRTLAGIGVTPQHHDTLAAVPDGPMILIANEFFDALPVRQFERTAEGWAERAVGLNEAGNLALVLVACPFTPPAFAAAAAPGAIVETAAPAEAVAAEIGARLAQGQGAALIIDYGHTQSAAGDTLQAVRHHQKVPVLERPGESDITAHVDFAALAAAMGAAGAAVHGPLTQQAFLVGLGLETRAQMLSMRATAAQRQDIVAAVSRLAGPHQMGHLFKVIAAVSPGLAAPEPFGSA